MNKKILFVTLFALFSTRVYSSTTLTVTCDGGGTKDVTDCLNQALSSTQVVNLGNRLNYKITSGLKVRP